MYRKLAIRLDRSAWVPVLVTAILLVAWHPDSVEGTRQQEGAVLEGARYCYTFLTETEPTGPRVTASRQALQISYGTGEVVYVGGDGTSDLEIGDEMQIVRRSGPIRHPLTEATLGDALSIMGTLEIVDVLGDQAMGRITSSCQETEKGDYLVPLRELEVAEPPELPPLDPNGVVVADESDATVVLGPLESVLKSTETMARGGITPYAGIGAGDVVTIDQGEDAGWSAGDLGLIYWSTGGSRYDLGGMASPPVVAARGMVIWADPDTANILLIDSDGAVELGMKVRRVDSATDD
jgi:hypothetical protein